MSGPVTALAAALELAEDGLPVFPVQQDKRPYTVHGFKEATKDPKQITAWWRRWPGALVGVPTGRASGLLVIDTDPEGAGWHRENDYRLACGRVHRTRRGHHLLYRYPANGEIRNSAGRIAPGVDVRGEGGYVIWWPCHGLQAVGGMEDLGGPPEWLLTELTNGTRTPHAGAQDAGEYVTEGQRNDFLSREAYRLRKQGCNAEQIIEVLRALNNARCSPPLPGAELAAIANGKARVEPDDDVAATVRRLSDLSPIEYDHVRQAEAETLGVRVTTLDAEVEKLRRTLNGAQGSEGSGEAVLFPELEPWPEPVDGAELLSGLRAMYRRHVVLPEHAPVALALWTLFTHAVPAVSVAPILALTSPVKRCGKTTVLALLRRLARRTLPSANISASALFRAVEAWEPTLLIDEADTFLRNNEELRGIANSGHTRDLAFVIRNVAVGDDHEPRRFSTWGAKAIALIGKLPDTLADRSIEVRLKRKLPGESVKKVRHADPDLFLSLAQRCARWAADHIHQIRTARPSMPEALNDRAQDSWEPLIAIADLAGGGWPKLARAAALKLSGAVDAGDDTLGVQLLSDIRTVLRDFKGSDRISGEDLTTRLLGLEDRPWPECSRGRPLTKTKLARLLRPFGVVSGSRRLPDGTTPKGYLLDQFPDSFERYLDPSSPGDPPFEAQHRHKQGGARVCEDFESATAGERGTYQNGPEPSCDAGCGGVADPNPPPWGTRL